MRIAVFTDLYTPNATGGIVSSIRAQKADLERLGHEVTVFCPGHDTKEKGVILVPTFKNLKINGAAMAKNPNLIEKFIIENFPDIVKYDVVHVHYESSCSIAGINIAKRYNIPLVQTMHGREDMAIAANVPHPVKNLVAGTLCSLHQSYLDHNIHVKKDKFQAPTNARAKMWQIMVNHAEQADVVITPSNHFAKKLEHYGVSRPLLIVPNGVSDDLVNEKFSERKFRSGDVLKMVWSSRVSSEKRIMPFLHAVASIKRPYVLYIYGDGNEEKKAKKFARDHKMKVKFFGNTPREKIIKRMSEAHLAVLASYNFDTQGMVLIEAEATGLPVFFCDPVLMEVVPAGSFILAGGPDPLSMAIALEKFDDRKISEMSKIMLKNRKDILQSAQTKKLLAAYKLAIREHDKRRIPRG